jgi:hypothetical protein
MRLKFHNTVIVAQCPPGFKGTAKKPLLPAAFRFFSGFPGKGCCVKFPITRPSPMKEIGYQGFAQFPQTFPHRYVNFIMPEKSSTSFFAAVWANVAFAIL